MSAFVFAASIPNELACGPEFTLFLVVYSECRAILRFRLPPIVEFGRRNVGMTEPLLDLGDVRGIRQGIGRGGGPHRVIGNPVHIEPGHQRPFLDDAAVKRGLGQGSGVVFIPVVAQGPEDGSATFFPVACLF